MARAAGSKDYVSFASGLITEASPLNFPDGATSRELNFLLDHNGVKRVKRKGLVEVDSIQDSFNVGSDDIDTVEVMGVWFWREPDCYVTLIKSGIGQSSGRDMIVQFNGRDGTDHGEFSYIAGVDHGYVTDITFIDNHIIMTTDEFNSHIIGTYDRDQAEIQFRSFEIYVRDFELVPDGYALDQRPSSLTDEHEYNLRNAGWYADRRNSSATFTDPIPVFYSGSGSSEYPSNADVAALGVKTDSSGDEIFSYDTLNETPLGSTEAPRGHFVYALSDTDREARLTSYEASGAPSTTVSNTVIGSVDLSGV